ncbi:MAG: hypothetical protein ACI91U_001976 [Candidatus Poriferisodalaceae bacterium]|jgi:hypothetical protein|tara:strand:+ start:87 stop:467 length:381 start_codon:yes stop_codon:yes gene_type:complete
MSISVQLDELGSQMERYGMSAYLLTVNENITTHIANQTFSIVNSKLECPLSRSAERNVALHPKVSILWPAYEIDGYSMIVDGYCSRSQNLLIIEPVSAVLHRPAQNKLDDNRTREDNCVDADSEEV